MALSDRYEYLSRLFSKEDLSRFDEFTRFGIITRIA